MVLMIMKIIMMMLIIIMIIIMIIVQPHIHVVGDKQHLGNQVADEALLKADNAAVPTGWKHSQAVTASSDLGKKLQRPCFGCLNLSSAEFVLQSLVGGGTGREG